MDPSRGIEEPSQTIRVAGFLSSGTNSSLVHLRARDWSTPMKLTRAAEYLRMSTEHQHYSPENQIATIQAYADLYGFEVIKTYSDAAKSGLRLKNRRDLQRLLQDVIGGNPGFDAVLVYDVSRWGRFQDADEAAHYEFLCRSAGIAVHYCAETFANDYSTSSTVMKAVKRAMAAEYSRGLGNQVFAAEREWAALGYKQGGSAGYGLKRLMISSGGEPKQVLAKGETKCLQSDRIILVPGNPKEVQCVQEIFRLVVEERKSPFWISQELNRTGMLFRGQRWVHQNVYRILTDPKYAGANVWNRSSRRLGGPNTPNPRSEWVIKTKAFEPIVAQEVFVAAQQVLAERTCVKSNEQILSELRRLLAKHGKLTAAILDSSPDSPSSNGCRRRFGGLQRAFELAGYTRPLRIAKNHCRP